MTAPQLNIAEAKLNPSKFFRHPQDVLVNPELGRETKIAILRQWETDARLMAVAEEENMGAGEHGHLGAIVSALLALGDPARDEQDHARGQPTKLGGGST